jgi:phosphoribosylformylglycinamidine synthase I
MRKGMMANKIRAIVITGNGINCEMEMAHACRLGGADEVEIVHISRLLSGEVNLSDFHFLNLPGGFVDGDDLGSAKANAARFRFAETAQGESLFSQLRTFINDGKLIFGICNGFQLLVKLGLVPSLKNDYMFQDVTLTHNDSGKFEDRWVYLKINENSPCVFTRGIENVYLPVRHGEGKIVVRDDNSLNEMRERNLIVAQYSDESCKAPSYDYPLNPNGSIDAIAGMCDSTGRVFGMMPHAEAYIHYTNHPRWTRGNVPEEGMGVVFFRKAVEYLKNTF